MTVNKTIGESIQVTADIENVGNVDLDNLNVIIVIRQKDDTIVWEEAGDIPLLPVGGTFNFDSVTEGIPIVVTETWPLEEYLDVMIQVRDRTTLSPYGSGILGDAIYTESISLAVAITNLTVF